MSRPSVSVSTIERISIITPRRATIMSKTSVKPSITPELRDIDNLMEKIGNISPSFLSFTDKDKDSGLLPILIVFGFLSLASVVLLVLFYKPVRKAL